MSAEQPWILPDGVDELLPEAAARLEHLRHALLSHFDTWGYELVFPPLLEYVESLTVGTGKDLAIQTYQVTDHLTGRTMGFRPDITAQVTRMDARQMQSRAINRLCYCGSILRARPAQIQGKRAQVQAGVELFGHAGIESDIEITRLMLESLAVAGFEKILLDIGHAGVIEAVFNALQLSDAARQSFLDILSRKSHPDLEAFLQLGVVSPEQQDLCRAMLTLHGPRAVLDQALAQLVPQVPAVEAPLREMMQVADQLTAMHPDIDFYFDVGEMRGLDYHTGLIVAAYDQQEGNLLAKGGRYDDVGAAFGRARAAIGFSMDLLNLAQLSPVAPVQRLGILAPNSADATLQTLVKQLRLSGERVVNALPEHEDAHALGCDRKIVSQEGDWKIVLLEAVKH